jgi:hypothetical protein
MGHRANFVVIQQGSALAYFDDWAGLGAAFAVADGPAVAIASLEEFSPTTALLDWAFAEGGFLLDMDEKVLIVFGELDDPLDDFDDVDDDDAEQEDLAASGDDLVDDESSSVQAYTEYFRQIAGKWQGWSLRYDDRGVDAFAEQLQRRGITTIAWQEPSHPESCQQLVVQA